MTETYPKVVIKVIQKTKSRYSIGSVAELDMCLYSERNAKFG